MHHATQALQVNFSFRFRGLVFVLIFCYLNTRPGHKMQKCSLKADSLEQSYLCSRWCSKVWDNMGLVM